MGRSKDDQDEEMEHAGDFVDYYDVLKVSPDCDGRILELAYHYFAKMYHPDNAETADPDKFSRVLDAYRALRDPDKREAYNRSYSRNSGSGAGRTPMGADLSIDENAALGDAETHTHILLALYKRRRECADEPGVIGWFLQDMLNCSEDQFQFHIWYLKQKGFIEVTEQGTIAVTVDGVDHVISTCRTTLSETLLLKQSNLTEN